jgi:multiple sugar transport system permease protein
VSSAVALNIVWRYIFNSEYGVAGFLFGHGHYWLTDPVLVKAAIIVKNVWAGLGGTMLLYLAGMQNISSVYYEAAEIDGANGRRKFFSITLPMLTPVTFYLITVGLIGGLQSYADSQVFAAGAPEAQTVVFFIWQRGIDNARYGIASAASVLLALVIMAATAAQFRLSNRWVFEE